jgi:glutamate racemase
VNSHHTSSLQLASTKRIGVFDSGVGGLSVLKAIHQTLSGESLLYFADSAHAPYGERDDAYVLERSTRIAEHLVANHCLAIVIACNTATAVAADALRQRWPHVPIVGVEPGIKPAVVCSKNHRVGVMATHSTLHSKRFRGLLARYGHGAQIIDQACTGLALAIEAGDLHARNVRELVDRHCAPLKAAGVDTVVLGCTHYAFVQDLIEQAMGPDVAVVDTAQAVAKEVARRLQSLPKTEFTGPGLRFESSGYAAPLVSLAQNWLGLDAGVPISSASNVVPGTGVEPVRPFSGSGGF